MKQNASALIFGIAIVLASFFLGNAYVKKNSSSGEIQVTGLGKADFTSDLIVWEGSYGAEDKDLKAAFLSLEQTKKIIKDYLVSNKIDEKSLVFSAVKTRQNEKRLYNSQGDYIGDEFIGYQLSQSVQIESNEVEKIERVSREVTELLNQGVRFYSEAPRYYYTKLADLKIEMISKATEDAKIRAEKISEFSGGEIGDLESAKMGVFQITGQNSKESYSWGGTYNTSSKEKTASITMKLVYSVK